MEARIATPELQIGSEMNGKPAPAIAVVGLGCWYPGARDPRQLWENVLSRRREFRRFLDQRLPVADYHDPDRTVPDKVYTRRAAYIDGFVFDWAGRRIPRNTVASTDIVHWLALEVARQALNDAGYSRDTVPRDRTGVIVGNTLTGEQTRANSMRLRWPFVRRVVQRAAVDNGLRSDLQRSLIDTAERLYKSVFPQVTEDTLAGGLSNTIAGRICNFYDFHGGGYVVDGACSSSLLAVCTAAEFLANHEWDIGLAGGVDVSLDTFELVGFAKAGALSPQDMNVYDRRASGFLPGEGCGFVVLKRLEDARAAGDTIYAILRGRGISSDGKGGITAPDRDGQVLAMQRAYARAGYGPHELDFIEGHGTGTPVGDKTELEAIAALRRADARSPQKACGVTSFKSIVGHTKAAAGIGALIKAVIAANRRVLPPTAGCREPHPVFSSCEGSLYPIILGEVMEPSRVLRVGVSSMGFGGINAHVTLESGDAPSATLTPQVEERALLVSSQESEIFVMGTASVPELLHRVPGLAQMAERLSWGDLTDFAAHLALERPDTQPVRAALIAGSPDELAEGLRSLERLLHETPPREGTVVANAQKNVWVSRGCQKNRIGFLFPGQGSQQVSMARVLVERYEWARDLVARADRWTTKEIGNPISPFIFRKYDRSVNEAEKDGWARTLAQTELAQPALCLASVIYARYLADLGIRPSVVGGHSLGELTAFHVAGSYDADTLFQLAAFRGRAMASSPERAGAMASLACTPQEADALAKRVSGYVVVANLNSPRQTVVSGEERAVVAVLDLATQKGISARRLPVSAAFHSRLVEKAATLLRSAAPVPEIVDGLSVTLVSSIDGKPVAPGCNLREHFSSQILAQVNFMRMVERMRRDCDFFVEVGPGRVLSGLVDDIVGSEEGACVPVAAKPDADRDLNRVLGHAFINGVEINWAALYEKRLVRPFVPPSERVFIDNPCERPLAPSESTSGSATAVPITAGDLEAASLRASGVGPDEFKAYLRHRQDFLAEVIKADLHSSRSLWDSPASDQADIAQGGIDSPGAPVPSAVNLSSPSTPGGTDGMEGLLVDLVSRRTGFPPESIQPGSRLLDDLNLDSIKAGELIAAASRKAGIPGRLDPSRLANATLAEIAAAIREASGTATPDGARSGSSSRSMTASAPRNWVRNFVIDYVPRALADLEYDRGNWAGTRILILSEPGEAEIAEVLRERLSSLGATVETRVFQRGSEKGSVPASGLSHLVGILPRKPGADEAKDGRARVREAVRRLHSLATLAPEMSATVAVVQFGGGRFGTGPSSSDPEVCCATAFARSLSLERQDLRVRVVDLSSAIDSGTAAGLIIKELSGPESFAAVGYDTDIVRLVPRARLQEPARYDRRPYTWSSKDVILVTGGAKGITAECALALARATGARLALVGSSPVPGQVTSSPSSDEVGRTLDRFRADGLGCRYYTCDITDPEAVKGLIEKVTVELGPPVAVVHGAGLNKPRRVEHVGPDEAMAEIAPKLLGARNLCNALAKTPPRFFVGLTSIIGVTGMPGNAWYAFSNEALDLVLRRFEYEHPGTSVLSIAYSAWGEAGMATRMGLVERLEQMGVGVIPSDEGVRRFQQLFENDPGEKQVIVSGRLTGLPTWRSLSEPVRPPTGFRFVDQVVDAQKGVELVTRTRLTLQRDPYLKDHNFRGSHLFPTVFGLEAMAQAATCLAGEEATSLVRVTDIRLDRPIVVDPENGTLIELRAEAHATAADGTRAVRAGIRAEQTGFTTDHFSATLVFGTPASGPRDSIARPETPLSLSPKTDLYGRILFQGPLFQRMGPLYALDHEHVVFGSECRASFPVGDGGPSSRGGATLVLGDPFFRDVLLQSVQLPASPDVVLPVAIETLEVFSAGLASGNQDRLVAAHITSREGKELCCDVVATDESGQVVERLKGYRVRIVETREDEGIPGTRKERAERYEERLREVLGPALRSCGFVEPRLALDHLPNLHALAKEQRHVYELPLIDRATRAWFGRDEGKSPHFNIEWLPSGKPRLSGDAVAGADLSVSHDDAYCLCVVGAGPQGCDLELITQRSPEDWEALIGTSRTPLVARLQSGGDSVDLAATRIWCAVEAAKKAIGFSEVDLTMHSRHEEAVIFAVRSPEGAHLVLTLPIRLPGEADRTVALVVHRDEDAPEGATAGVIRACGPYDGFYESNHAARLRLDENQTQHVYEYLFQPAFRDSAGLRHGVFFTSYLAWAGKVRELFMSDIGPRLAAQISSGEWGFVTNWTDVRITGEATAYDRLLARLRIGDVEGSKIPLSCEFWKIVAGRIGERLALVTQETTWVRVIDHGKVAAAPFPPYLAEFIGGVRGKGAGDDGVVSAEELPAPDRGRILHEVTDSPAGAPVIWSETFRTTLEDSNLVGNVYYANYFTWQGRVRDIFIHSIAPEYMRGHGATGELLCVRSRVDYLRDAMPFDQILVTLSVRAISERGARLGLQYFREMPGGQREKLAVGAQDVIWAVRPASGGPASAPLPETLRRRLLEAVRTPPVLDAA